MRVAGSGSFTLYCMDFGPCCIHDSWESAGGREKKAVWGVGFGGRGYLLKVLIPMKPLSPGLHTNNGISTSYPGVARNKKGSPHPQQRATTTNHPPATKHSLSGVVRGLL